MFVDILCTWLAILPPLPQEQILSFMSRAYFARAALSRKANRKARKLFPFVKVMGNHGGVPRIVNTSAQHIDIAQTLHANKADYQQTAWWLLNKVCAHMV